MSDEPGEAEVSLGGRTPRLEEITGAVVCGGRSSRFGADKARYSIGGRTLLERALAALAPARERLVVGRDYHVAGARFVPDLRPGQGPLAGLEAALGAARTAWVALAACDLPCLTPRYWRVLCEQAAGFEAVVVREPSGRLEPLAALYHRSVLERVSARLDAHSLSMHELIGALARAEIHSGHVEEVCGRSVLRNVNRPGDVPEGEDPCRD